MTFAGLCLPQPSGPRIPVIRRACCWKVNVWTQSCKADSMSFVFGISFYLWLLSNEGLERRSVNYIFPVSDAGARLVGVVFHPVLYEP